MPPKYIKYENHIEFMKMFEWPIVNQPQYNMTMELTERAHAAIVGIVGPNAKFTQNTTTGALKIATNFGASRGVSSDHLYKVGLVTMFPDMRDEIMSDNLCLTHLSPE